MGGLVRVFGFGKIPQIGIWMPLKVILLVASGLGDGENILIPSFYLLSRYFFDTRITFNCEKSPADSLQKKTGYFMRFE